MFGQSPKSSSADSPAEFTVKYGSENVNSLDDEVDRDAATDESVPDLSILLPAYYFDIGCSRIEV